MAQQFTQDGVIYEDLGDGNVRVVGHAPQQRPMTIGTPNPAAQYEAPMAQANLEAKRADLASAPFAAQKAQADAQAAALAVQLKQRELNNPSGGPESAKTRADALAGYKSAQQLDGIITDLEAKFKAGPGATSGLSGLADYLPYTENKQFDNSGNAARGTVGQALGFTGGQLNTATEAAMAVGPYLPQSSDRDAVILDKIQRLKDLRDNARERAIAQLGGIPDANGRVTPVDAHTAPDRRQDPGVNQTQSFYRDGAGGDQGGGMQLAGGGTRSEKDPALAGANAHLNAMLKAGKSDQQISAYLQSRGVNPATTTIGQALEFRRKNPTYKGGYAVNIDNRDVPMSGTRQVMNSISQSPVGAFGINAGNAVTAGNLDSLVGLTGGDAGQARMGIDAVSALNPKSAMAGTLTGGAIAAGGLELGLAGGAARLGLGAAGRAAPWIPRAADAIYGGASGAGSADGGDRGIGALQGALGGTLGGMFGRAVPRVGGKVLSGVTSPGTQYLRQSGVPLTLGQAAGGTLKGIEDRLAGLPVVGDMINARRREGFQGFNKAAFDEALAPIGGTTLGNIGEQGVETAQDAVSGAYDSALNGVNVRADAPFKADMLPILQRARGLPEPMATGAGYTLGTRVGNSFGPNGELSGNGFQQAIRGMNQDAAAVRNQPYGHDFNAITNDTRSALEGILQRQTPDTLPAYNLASEAYRNTKVLQDAVNRGRVGTRTGEPGLFAPSQLADAAAANSRKFGGTQGTTRQPFFDLTRAGQILPSSVPDSGTAGRLAAMALPGALAAGSAGTGGTGSATGQSLGLAALVAGAYTKSGQKLLVKALLDRPDLLRLMGQQAQRAAPIAGMFGAAAGPALLPRQ